MQIVQVVPLTRIPIYKNQIYTFFSSKQLEIGSRVRVPFGARKVSGLVINRKPFNKLVLRKHYTFPLRGISRVVRYKPVLHESHIKLALWISDYFLEPLGLVFKVIITRYRRQASTVMDLSPSRGLRDRLFNFDQNLTKIILRDSTNDLYKSQSAPRFDARTVAQKIATICQAQLIIKDKPLKKTKLTIIDMNQQSDLLDGRSILSSPLLELISGAKRPLLFLHRLGSFTFIRCQDCGQVTTCTQCEVPLVHHFSLGKLLCHHCGKAYTLRETCEKCKGSKINYSGVGVERVYQEARLKLGRSIPVTTLKQDIPLVDLIGVVSIDNIINLPDFRSAEKAHQMLRKLNNHCRHLVIQTFMPSSHVFDFDNFFKKEQVVRKQHELPPYSLPLIKLTYQNKQPARARQEAERVASLLSPFLGPAPAFIPKVRSYYRWHLVVKAHPDVKKKLRNLELPKGWTSDVEPLDLL